MERIEAYSNAEKKIEQALLSGIKTLDLSTGWDAIDFEKLIELPESIGQLTQLESLGICQ